MADIELVIKIPEDDYKEVKEDTYSGTPFENRVFSTIANGTPLPKGHGRLFDERDIVNGNYEIIGNKIYELEPIIEADIPTMYYPQVEGITPTVISSNGSEMLSAEEIDNLLQALAKGESEDKENE